MEHTNNNGEQTQVPEQSSTSYNRDYYQLNRERIRNNQKRYAAKKALKKVHELEVNLTKDANKDIKKHFQEATQETRKNYLGMLGYIGYLENTYKKRARPMLEQYIQTKREELDMVTHFANAEKSQKLAYSIILKDMIDGKILL
jgi:hypothetical protein